MTELLVVSLWGVSYSFSNEHPRHFYMRVPPGINSALVSLSYGPHFLSPLVYVLDVSSSTWKNTGSVTNSQAQVERTHAGISMYSLKVFLAILWR